MKTPKSRFIVLSIDNFPEEKRHVRPEEEIMAKRFKKTEIRFNVSDILNARYRFFQDWDNDLEFGTGDSLFINQRQGTTVSISFAYKL